MKCGNCGATRENIETFFTYGVEIEKHGDLESALKGMQSGEVISDCFCEKCHAKSDTTKRTLLKQIPEFFFVHLKRIVFDYTMFVNKKIHSRLHFPLQLNIEPFLKEGVELRERLGPEAIKQMTSNPRERSKF